MDRNAGVEYFDSPGDNRDVYDAYVIDCVPEREDLGCLQLITSTTNLEEVRGLLDDALDQMGLSHSRRNAEFLMGQLKSLSGRLAIRLTGRKAPTSELIALALSHAQARRARDSDECWLSLRDGFLIPVDDVRDLIPPVKPDEADSGEGDGGRGVSPDLIHVSKATKGGLQFRFIEVKYRRHLRDARTPEVLETIKSQVESLGQRWRDWYSCEDALTPFRALRRAKLARVLRFYADKALRHADKDRDEGLTSENHQALVAEIDRMIEKGADYSFANVERGDRGWVFCPEYAGANPNDLSPPDWGARIFLFGPNQLPDRPSSGSPMEGPAAPAPDVSPVPTAKPRPVESGRQAAAPESATSEEKPDIPAPEIKLGVDLFTKADVSWPLTVKGNPHLLLAGLPGMGKTTCLLNICKQMIDAGVRPIIFSYHEDIDQKLSDLAPSMRFLDFDGLGFNPLRIIERKRTTDYVDIAASLRDIFRAIFPDLGDIQGGFIRDAIKDSFIEKGWDSADAFTGAAQEPDFGRFVEILKSRPKPEAGLKTLLTRLAELADYGFFNVVESNESLWDSRDPIVIRVHKSQNEVLQRAFAALIFYKLYKEMFRRGIQDRITHAVIFDEAHRAARLGLIPTMAKECRKYGISLILASQEARDFHSSLFSAIANYLILRVTEQDAKALVRNVTASDQERALIDKLKQMGKHKALFFSEQLKKPTLVELSP